MNYRSMTKAQLIDLLEERDVMMPALELATRRAVHSLGPMSEWQQARASAAMVLVEQICSDDTKAGDMPRLVREWRELISALEPPQEPDDEDFEEELRRLTSG